MYAGSCSIDDVAWYNDNAGATTHPVATKAPNELGLFDMSGNVFEYCQDNYVQYYPSEPQLNPLVTDDINTIVIRGGSIDYGTEYCRTARRWGDDPTSKWKDQGMRLAL